MVVAPPLCEMSECCQFLKIILMSFRTIFMKILLTWNYVPQKLKNLFGFIMEWVLPPGFIGFIHKWCQRKQVFLTTLLISILPHFIISKFAFNVPSKINLIIPSSNETSMLNRTKKTFYKGIPLASFPQTEISVVLFV